MPSVLVACDALAPVSQSLLSRFIQDSTQRWGLPWPPTHSTWPNHPITPSLHELCWCFFSSHLPSPYLPCMLCFFVWDFKVYFVYLLCTGIQAPRERDLIYLAVFYILRSENTAGHLLVLKDISWMKWESKWMMSEMAWCPVPLLYLMWNSKMSYSSSGATPG